MKVFWFFNAGGGNVLEIFTISCTEVSDFESSWDDLTDDCIVLDLMRILVKGGNGRNIGGGSGMPFASNFSIIGAYFLTFFGFGAFTGGFGHFGGY